MSGAIQINKLAAETLLIPIVGTTPLIVHNWSEKAKRQMLDAQQGKKTPKQFKDPEADYLASLYHMEFDDGRRGFGFPAVAFKAATVGAARFYGKDVKMTELRQFMFFRGSLLLLTISSFLRSRVSLRCVRTWFALGLAHRTFATVLSLRSGALRSR